MVRRKALEKSHGGLEKQLSSHLLQETKMKVKKMRPIEVSDPGYLENSPMNARLKKPPPPSSPIRNYMKPTRCSDAKKEKQQAKKSSNYMEASGLRKKSSFMGFYPKKKLNRATCSSTLKDSRFPATLELNHGGNEAEGTSKMKVCPYLYCSLNGHFRQPLPPIKSFLAAKRKAMIVNRVSSSVAGKKKDKETENELGKNPLNFFAEICDIDEISIHDGGNLKEHSQISSDEMDENMLSFLEFVELDRERGTGEESELPNEAETEKSALEAMDVDWKEEEETEVGVFPDDTKGSEITEEKQANDSTQITRKMRAEELEKDDAFNPRPPRFLPMAADPEAEQVDLRHQMMDDRKIAEEWMIDYALRRVISNLGSDRKRKVALLVEAFETVVPLAVCEEAFSHGGSSALPNARSIKACS
ncbi:hypothetical protein AXF42_Ash008588 [Apostasia shenzhenica]|uniref:Calmodulin-binding domain-containing protein n=1 Tax=Apostasia shenzhenica TaxID=1088818 RepID=A0A2I0B1T0_9ASPA|nr:hypothetical protein AXF42_Ash008588 [Apostasia shenzhenica]